jgi:hypothetical protein
MREEGSVEETTVEAAASLEMGIGSREVREGRGRGTSLIRISEISSLVFFETRKRNESQEKELEGMGGVGPYPSLIDATISFSF